MYEQIQAAKSFTERVNAVHCFISSLGDECSQSNVEGQTALDAVKKISDLVRAEMDTIAKTMTEEESVAAITLFETLKRVIVREKKWRVARSEFDALSFGMVQ
jgi:hypothetical protein